MKDFHRVSAWISNHDDRIIISPNKNKIRKVSFVLVSESILNDLITVIVNKYLTIQIINL